MKGAVLMTGLLVSAFLFAVGSFYGWIIEVIFRRFFSKKNPERRWLNPGFCLGPCIPLYGFGLVALFFLSYFGDLCGYGETLLSKFVLFIIMALIMTFIELIAGLMCVKIFKLRLWDYRDEWGNFMGLICPKFTFLWTVLAALYYFLIQPSIMDSVEWLVNNQWYLFFVGLFYGIFIIDVVISSGVALKIREYANKNNVVVERDRLDSAPVSRIGGLGKGLLGFLFNSRVHNK